MRRGPPSQRQFVTLEARSGGSRGHRGHPTAWGWLHGEAPRLVTRGSVGRSLYLQEDKGGQGKQVWDWLV